MTRRLPCLVLPALASVLLLPACSDSDPKPAAAPAPPDPAAQAPQPPMIVGATYAAANLAYQLAAKDFRVVYPVPVDTDPARWEPSATEVLAMRKADHFLVIAGEEPPWFGRLTEGAESKVIAIDPTGDFSVGFDPAQVRSIAAAIAERLQAIAPTPEGGKGLALRAEVLDEQLAAVEQRWRIAAARLKPEALVALEGDLGSWISRYGAPITLVPATDALGDGRTPANLLVPKQPGTLLKSEMKVRGIDVVGFDSGRERPATGDLIAVLEKNLDVLSAFVDPNSTATPSAGSSAPVAANPTPHTGAPAGAADFEQHIVPMIEKYCLECHDAVTGEGEVDFEVYLTEREAIMVPDLWESVGALLDMREMPPRKETTQPSEEERQMVIAWVEGLVERWDQGEMGKHPGHTTIRRLNKNEYNYTMRDLFGMQVRPADNFPEDGGGEAGFDNNSDALFLPSLLMENYVEAAGLIVQAIYGDRDARARYLFAVPSAELPQAQAARTVLEFWATRAYRRPVEEGEMTRLMQIFSSEITSGKPYPIAMRMPLLAILISPNFLYRAEDDKATSEPVPVGDYDLASRLSYFLWSSMPDQTLIDLAASGKLSDPAVFEAQVDRMLDDDKSRALSLHFAGQWLGWEELRSRANPDTDRYPSFTFELRVAMYRESAEFFHQLIGTNASAYDLLDSDYTFINDLLARHYGIPGVSGPQLRKVQLADRNRGGVIGMASVLTATSLPLRSSPAKRGEYVLASLLGTPPPEPPMDVAQLPDDDQEIEAQTFRDALVQHRQDPNCQACHELLDPIGFGLENFDAIGRWRTHQNGIPLDSSGVMPDGTAFAAPADLKQRLMDNKELFVRNFAEKLLSYALGRELSPYDRPAVRRIADAVIADGGNIRTAFLEVARSYPFRYRSATGNPAVASSAP